MLKLYSVVVLCLLPFSYSYAGDIAQFDKASVASSIKCELGMFARETRKKYPSISSMKAKFTIGYEQQERAATSISGGIWDFVSGSNKRNYITTDADKQFAKYNIHPENTKNCNRKSKINVGVLECLRRNVDMFVGDNAPFSCSKKIVAGATSQVGAKLKVWIVGVDPSAEFEQLRTFSLDSEIPAGL